MFTGLVQEIGTVEQISFGALAELWIRASFAGVDLKPGESVAVDGACLTVVDIKPGAFQVQASPETLRRTTLGSLRRASRVNLERALSLGDRLGGHLVLGHVDAVSQILASRPEGGSRVMELSLPGTLAALFIEKGSVALDGVSLTVNQLTSDRFGVALIPETQRRTTLGAKQVGQRVNVEADLIGKYIARLYSLGRGGTPISEETLRAAFGPRS